MITIIILLGSLLVFTGISSLSKKRYFASVKDRARYGLSIMLIIIGSSHFTNSAELIQMIPSFLPFPELINIATGIMEFAFAVALLFNKYYKLTGKIIAIYFVLIFPANINNAIYSNEIPGGLNNIPYYLWIRLLFQPFYIWWALWSTHESVRPRD